MPELKTVRVNASMVTDLYLDINVPKDMDTRQLHNLLQNHGLIDAECLHQDDGLLGGSFRWCEETDMDFNPDLDDLSAEIAELREEIRNGS